MSLSSVAAGPLSRLSRSEIYAPTVVTGDGVYQRGIIPGITVVTVWQDGRRVAHGKVTESGGGGPAGYFVVGGRRFTHDPGDAVGLQTVTVHYPDAGDPARRYDDLADRVLAGALAAEDAAEEAGRLNPGDRRTCHPHRSWYRDCWPHPLHANRVNGHNWCRICDTPLANCPHRPGQPDEGALDPL